MTSRTYLLAWSLLAFGTLSLQPWPAAAQVGGLRPERPERGLFKNRPASDGDRLDLNGSIGAGWDDNVLLDLPGANDPRVQGKSGSIGTASGGLSYTTTGKRGRLNASASSSARYYPGQTLDLVTGHGANVSGVALLSDRTSIYGGQSFSYQPFTFSSIFPTSFSPSYAPELLPVVEATPADFVEVANKAKYVSYLTSAGVSRDISKRTTFSASYHFDRSETAYDNGSFSSQGASAGLRFSLARGLGLRAGGGYQKTEYPRADGHLRNYTLDTGLDYNRALSFSRRTTLSFSTGSSAISDGSRTRFQVIGSANLNHEIGRTWNSTISYDRSFQFVSALLEPVFYDSVTGGFGGLVNRRVRIQTTARASIGTIGFSRSQTPDNDFDTYLGNATLSFALSRFFDLGASYSVYQYRFGADTILPINVARNVSRQSVSISLSAWAPVFNRARKNNATR